MVVIRTAHPDEHHRIARVTYEGFGHGQPSRPDPDPDRLNLLLDAGARAASGDLLVAVDEAEAIIGTASLLRSGTALSRQAIDGEAELRLLAVLPTARRLGVGLGLMLEAINRVRLWGADALVLDTGPHNFRSQRLYHSLGFDRIPERESQMSSSGSPLAVFRYRLDDPDGLVARLSSGEAREVALRFWRRAIAGSKTSLGHSESPNDPEWSFGLESPGQAESSDRLEHVDVWRVEEREERRLAAVVLTHRLRPHEEIHGSGAPVLADSVLAPVAQPIVIGPGTESAAVHAAITRLLSVLAHGRLAIPGREPAAARAV